jgi:hypothetical protein
VEVKQASIGDFVIFTEPDGTDHNALVTCVWSPVTINVVYVSSDLERKDQYGRQIVRHTSVMHKSTAGIVHGPVWRWPDETKNEYAPPLAS